MPKKYSFLTVSLGAVIVLGVIGCGKSEPTPAPTTSDDQYWKKGGAQPQSTTPNPSGEKGPR